MSDSHFEIYSKADGLIELEKFKEAAALLESILGDEEVDAYCYIRLNPCYLGLNRKDKAKKILEMALEKYPNNAYVHAQQSYFFTYIEQFKKALKSIQIALEIEPNEIRFLTQIIIVHVHLKEYAKALHYVKLAEAEDPNYFDLISSKAIIYYEKGDYDQSLLEVHRGLEQEPNDSTLLILKSNIMSLDPKKMKEAEAFAISSLELDPNDEFAKSSLLEILKNRNWLLRFFVGRSFNRYRLEWSFGRIVLMIICWKGVFLWGGIALLYLLITWYGGVMFNTFSRLSFKYKLLLSKNDIRQSNLFIGLNIALIGLIIYTTLNGYDWKTQLAIYSTAALVFLPALSFFEIQGKTGKISFFVFMGIAAFLLSNASFTAMFFGLLSLFLLLVYAFLFSLRIAFK